MVILRECDENDDLVEIRTHEEKCRIWKHCVANTRQRDEGVDWKLV